jgi:peroxiredoxin
VTAASLARELAEICVMDAPLWRRIETWVAKQRAAGSPFVGATQGLADRLQAGEVGRDAPKVGERLPPFLLPDQRGHLIALEDLLGPNGLVLSFNRGHWCPFCQIELAALAQAHDDFVKLGANVVSIMPDRQAYVGRLPGAVTGRLSILSDVDNAYALSIGLVMWLGDQLKDLMMRHGVRLDDIQGNENWTVPVPATFVLDRAGVVVARTVEPDIRKRMDMDEISRALSGSREDDQP